MKKFISLILALVVACSFCVVSFADSPDTMTNASATEVEPRRAEPIEVVVGKYLCTDSGGDLYRKYVYRTYLVPAGKTLVCRSSEQYKWTQTDYTVDGRVWDRVSYYEWTYEII